MKEKICYCFGAGTYYSNEKADYENSFIIGVDAGIKEIEKRGLKADLIIGDFDSLGKNLSGENVIKLPCIKDDTDMIAAVKEGLKRGIKKFIIFGGTGGRIAHTLSNIDTLSYIAEHGGTGFLCGEVEDITVVCKGIHFDTDFKGFISVFPHGGEAIISEKGLKYELDKKTLRADFPLGVSNEFLGKESEIIVHQGKICAVIEKQNNISVEDYEIS